MIPPAMQDEANPINLNTLVVAGEKINPNILEYYYSKKVKLINAYGPTESTVCISLARYKNNGHTNIGKPIFNTKVYVLDNALNPLPIGAIGELYTGGVGLARGYLNRPDLTAEKFINNPFKQGKKLYKTGDLVRWLDCGNLEYIGRNDFQVKIRGYRIELSEIEASLSAYDGVKQAVVIAKDSKNGTKYLVGYYVGEAKLEQNKLYEYLEAKLPDYMVPSILVRLEKLPLTLNGKIDQKALPSPEFSGDLDDYLAPRNELEAQLAKVWSAVLQIPGDKIGVRDNFFRLGGNSILAIKLTAKINRDLSFNAPVASIFKNTTIEKLATYLTSFINETTTLLIKKSIVSRAQDQLLSFAQERLWFIYNYEGRSNTYNIPMMFKLAKMTDSIKLESAISKVITRHEILRTIIKENTDSNSYQVILDAPLRIEKITLPHKSLLDEELHKQFNYNFNLSSEHPIKACLYQVAGETYLSIVVHHIAFDGWSVDIF